jgi:hypothetical protein
MQVESLRNVKDTHREQMETGTGRLPTLPSPLPSPASAPAPAYPPQHLAQRMPGCSCGLPRARDGLFGVLWLVICGAPPRGKVAVLLCVHAWQYASAHVVCVSRSDVDVQSSRTGSDCLCGSGSCRRSLTAPQRGGSCHRSAPPPHPTPPPPAPLSFSSCCRRPADLHGTPTACAFPPTACERALGVPVPLLVQLVVFVCVPLPPPPPHTHTYTPPPWQTHGAATGRRQGGMGSGAGWPAGQATPQGQGAVCGDTRGAEARGAPPGLGQQAAGIPAAPRVGTVCATVWTVGTAGPKAGRRVLCVSCVCCGGGRGGGGLDVLFLGCAGVVHGVCMYGPSPHPGPHRAFG